jgi:4-hydroxyproline epimerase
VLISGVPEHCSGTVADRLAVFRANFDRFRSAVVNEPRGHAAIVGALLCEPSQSSCSAGVIFFNNVGYLNMCGHGAIGLLVTLVHLGRLGKGVHRIETPVGVVTAELLDPNTVSIANVPSYREARSVKVDVPGHGPVIGDVAWGGNWFFLVDDSPLPIELSNLDALTEFAWAVRLAVNEAGYALVDHIELSSGYRNFVLCPGKAYDRSPCGTGTSAKLACLFSDGKLRPGEVWRQESIVGSVFEGRVSLEEGKIIPHITGTAYVTAEAQLLFNENDPFCWGLRQ